MYGREVFPSDCSGGMRKVLLKAGVLICVPVKTQNYHFQHLRKGMTSLFAAMNTLNVGGAFSTSNRK
jgi:hypothetical protein